MLLLSLVFFAYDLLVNSKILKREVSHIEKKILK